MSREILFRGKRLDNGEWAEGWYFEHLGKSYILPLIASQSEHTYFFDYMVEVDPATVWQFAGFIDETNDDTRVFEGDIILYRADNGKSFNTYVKHEVGMFILVSDEFNDGYSSLFDCSESDRDTCYVHGEVIGNVHDNPELLEATQ